MGEKKSGIDSAEYDREHGHGDEHFKEGKARLGGA
jgi:hypothetical protein